MLPQLGFDVPMGAIAAEQAAAAFALWHKAVAGSVAPERLLVLDVFGTPSDELWRQLCAFLGRPPPRDAPRRRAGAGAGAGVVRGGPKNYLDMAIQHSSNGYV